MIYTKSIMMVILRKLFKNPIFYAFLLIALVHIVFACNSPVGSFAGDTSTYTSEYDPGFRTPVYPVFTNFISVFSGDSWSDWFPAVGFVQRIIFDASIILFFFTVRMITKKPFLLAAATFLYGAAPGIFSWSYIVMTECFAIIEGILLLFFTLKYLRNHRIFDAAAIGLVILLTIMTRPSSLYLIVAYIFFWCAQLILMRKNKAKELLRSVYVGCLSMVLVVCCVFCYCANINAKYGVFSISKVSYINNVLTVIDSGLYRKSDNLEIIEAIGEPQKPQDIYDVLWGKLLVKFSGAELRAFSDAVIRENRITYYKILFYKALNWGAEPIVDSYLISTHDLWDYSSWAIAIMPFTFGAIYIVVSIGMLFVFSRFVREKKLNLLLLIILLCICGNLATMVLAAPYEPARLFVASIPILMSGVIYVIDVVLSKKHLFKYELTGKNIVK